MASEQIHRKIHNPENTYRQKSSSHQIILEEQLFQQNTNAHSPTEK